MPRVRTSAKEVGCAENKQTIVFKGFGSDSRAEKVLEKHRKGGGIYPPVDVVVRVICRPEERESKELSIKREEKDRGED